MPTQPIREARHKKRQNTRPAGRMSLTRLRGIIPPGAMTFDSGLHLARRQADLLLGRRHPAYPIPIDVISDLSGIRLEYLDQRPSGASFWDTESRRWVIQLSRADRAEVRRYAAARELKHILDDPHLPQLYQENGQRSATWQAETAADYFARCLLIPKALLNLTWQAGLRSVGGLADLFCVEEGVMRNRLADMGLFDKSEGDLESLRDLQRFIELGSTT